MTASLLPGECIREGAGYPSLVWFQKSDPSRPLIVFLTGGGVLARIAYGCSGARPTDFLAHWLGEAGHPFLALSYPLGHPVFATTHPAFGVRDWGEQSAALIEALADEHGLSRQVVVLGWSMAGRVVNTLAASLAKCRIELELFVGLAAGAPLPNLFPGLDAMLRPAPSGLAHGGEAYAAWLLRNLREQDRRQGRVVIPEATFKEEFLGDFPVNLTATALRFRSGGTFVEDLAADIADTAAFAYADTPLVAVITNEGAIEDRHALIDTGAWSLYQSQVLYRDAHRTQRDLSVLPPDRWDILRRAVVEGPARLGTSVPGGHFFFVGEQGAKATVDAVTLLRGRAADLRRTIEQVVA